MKISDIKTLLTNKLSTLEVQKLNALSLGDIEAYNRATSEIEETKQTLNEIN